MSIISLHQTVRSLAIVVAVVSVCNLQNVHAGSAQWNLNPASGNWNTPANWTPATVPNGSADMATFGVSNTTTVSTSAITEVKGIVFNLGASAYTITSTANAYLTLSGTGIINNSGTTQNLLVAVNAAALHGQITFANSATAGSNTFFTNNGGTVGPFGGGIISFSHTSSASTATFATKGGTVDGAVGGATQFFQTATSGSGTFTTDGGTADGALGGVTQFFDNSTAGSGAFTTGGGAVDGAGGGITRFWQSATAGNGSLTTNGGATSDAIGGSTQFFDSASAGSATFITNPGTINLTDSNRGHLEFFNTSTAGDGTFTSNGGSVTGEGGGRTRFFDMSTGGSGTFTSNGSTADGAFGGRTDFTNTSSAANGSFTNNPGTVSAANGGHTRFFETSTAGSGTFTNIGGTVDGADGGITRFFDMSTGGSGTFTTNGGTAVGAGGGRMQFFNSSTAGSGNFSTYWADVAGANGGLVEFHDTSSASNGTFENFAGNDNGTYGAATQFFGTASGGNGAFTNYGTPATGAGGGSTRFFDNSSAGSGTYSNNNTDVVGAEAGLTIFFGGSGGNGTFTNYGSNMSGAGSGYTLFLGTSTAGNGAFTNNAGPGGGGGTEFGDTSSAENGTFTNNGATASGEFSGGTSLHGNSSAGNGVFLNNGGSTAGASGAVTFFFDSSSAMNGTFTNYGGMVSGAGGGITAFFNTSTAENSTLIANGGPSGDGHGAIVFLDDSTGGTSRVEVYDTGELNLDGGHVTIGSIEGSGLVFLGANNLTVGSNNLSTTFSGLIQDSGSLTKIGMGTFTLTGANIYSGGTQVSAGRLLVENTSGSATGDGNVTVDTGATLGGNGTIQLGGSTSLTNNGTIAPGDSAGQLTIDGDLQLGSSSNLSLEIGGTSAATDYDVLNKINGPALTLNGTLSVSLINGFTPEESDTFTIVTTQVPLGGAFTNVPSGQRLNTMGGGGSFRVIYTVINNAILSSNVTLSDFGPPSCVPPTPAPGLTIVRASPLTGPLTCKPGYPEPQCWAQAFDTTNDLAFQGNGFAQPAVAKDNIQCCFEIHQPGFANDGSYGNGASWISDSENSWLKVDLGRTVLIDHITIGRDRLGGFDDRDPGQFIIAVATADNAYANGDDSNDTEEYTQVFDSANFGFSGVISGPETIEARFTKVVARFIKVSVANAGAAIDEVGVSPPSRLVGWWPGDGNANDIIGGSNGTLQGNVTFAPGMVGQAFSFDGSSYVDASDSNLPVGNSSATISAWINTTQTGQQFFVSWGSRSFGCNPGNEIALGIVDNHLALENCGGNVQGSTIVNDGAWHHVVGVWYGSNNATLYVDGVQQTDISPQPLPPINIISSGHLNIGQLVEHGGNFSGLVDEVQVFNGPLAASEIQAIYNAGSTGVCKPLSLLSAFSRKSHGGVDHDIPLNLTGTPTVECRSSGGSHKLVLTFTNVVVSGDASLTTQSGGSISGTPSFSGNTMTVDLSGVTNAQTVTITLENTTDVFAQVLPTSQVSMSVLVGDTNNGGSVNSTDVSQTKLQSGQGVTASNFRNDVIVTGSINGTDVSAVKLHVGSGVP